MMALRIVKIYLGSPFSPISVVRGQFVRGQLVRGQFVAVSCRGPRRARVIAFWFLDAFFLLNAIDILMLLVRF